MDNRLLVEFRQYKQHFVSNPHYYDPVQVSKLQYRTRLISKENVDSDSDGRLVYGILDEWSDWMDIS